MIDQTKEALKQFKKLAANYEVSKKEALEDENEIFRRFLIFFLLFYQLVKKTLSPITTPVLLVDGAYRK